MQRVDGQINILLECCLSFQPPHFDLYPPSLRALNEMWKCQNLLRNHVKDLLDLIKKPKVTDRNKAQYILSKDAHRFLQAPVCI